MWDWGYFLDFGWVWWDWGGGLEVHVHVHVHDGVWARPRTLFILLHLSPLETCECELPVLDDLLLTNENATVAGYPGGEALLESFL